MLGPYVLVLDTFCEMAQALEPYADQTFWDLAQVDIPIGAVVVLSRQTLNQHCDRVKAAMHNNSWLPVLVNPTEGSQTMKYQCMGLGLEPYLTAAQMLLVGCGDMQPNWPCMWYDSYRHKPYDYEENLQQCELARAVYTKLHKPYKFLFLNGRTRAHRKYLMECLRDLDLLQHSLWTNLDTTPVPAHMNFYGSRCERVCEINLLPPQYEVQRYRSGLNKCYEYKFVKAELFDQDWGEIYLQAEPYIDTYFSVVSETVFEYPYSLRSEKIYKPIAIGHPFVAAANRGFYRDLHNAGFKTFGHLIDESFDQIDNGLDRLNRLVTVIQDLCQQDLAAFVVAAQDICVYNQQHMRETASQIKREFVPRFQEFLQHWKK